MSRLALSERSWSSALVASMRRWWWIPVLAGCLGALVGVMVSRGAPTSATSQVGVQVVSSGGDSTLVEQVVSGALERLGSRSVLSAAAQARREDYADLSARTTVSEVGTSTILQIVTSAPTRQQAVDDANAVAQAAIDDSSSMLASSLASLTQQSQSLISRNRLSNPRVEAARVTSVGTQLGVSQTDMIARYGSLTSVSPATIEDASKPSAVTPGLLAGVGCGILGLGAALALGARRGRIRSLGEVRRVARKGHVVLPQRRGATLRVIGAQHRVIVFSPLRSDSWDPETREAFEQELVASGRVVVPGRLEDLSATMLELPARGILLIDEPASPELMELVTGRPDATVIVGIRLKHDSIEELAEVESGAASGYHIVVS